MRYRVTFSNGEIWFMTDTSWESLREGARGSSPLHNVEAFRDQNGSNGTHIWLSAAQIVSATSYLHEPIF